MDEWKDRARCSTGRKSGFPSFGKENVHHLENCFPPFTNQIKENGEISIQGICSLPNQTL